MAQQNDCTEILELIPDYAFGLTDEATSRRIEAGLPTCPEAVEQLAEYQSLQADMREDIPQIAPPPTLAARLAEAIAQDSAPNPSTVIRQAPPRGMVMPDVKRYRSDPGKAQPQEPAAPPPPLTPIKPPRTLVYSRRRSLLLPLIAAAAAIALVVTNVYWLNRVNTLSKQMQDATDLINQTQGSLFSVRNADTLELVRLQSDENDGFAMMMWDKDSPTGLIYTRNFPRSEIGKVYQLWLLRGGTRVSCGTFSVADDGEGAMIFTAPEAISEYEAVGITEEPEGGSDWPTSSPVVTGAL